MPLVIGTHKALLVPPPVTSGAPVNAIQNTTAGYVLNTSAQYVLNTG